MYTQSLSRIVKLYSANFNVCLFAGCLLVSRYVTRIHDTISINGKLRLASSAANRRNNYINVALRIYTRLEISKYADHGFIRT